MSAWQQKILEQQRLQKKEEAEEARVRREEVSAVMREAKARVETRLKVDEMARERSREVFKLEAFEPEVGSRPSSTSRAENSSSRANSSRQSLRSREQGGGGGGSGGREHQNQDG